MIQLLSPVGDFECLKAAVQNGADSVYFGGNLFNARHEAHNFDKEELKKAVRYAKLRNVNVDFTLNTLIKDEEFQDAVDLAEYVYQLGVDSIIVQDLGLAEYLIKHYPDVAIHASTQMTIHNLEGVLKLQELGFSRVVLSRELSIHDIEYICKNCDIEIETFIHGALCISYSGQCLFSSAVGTRSGNRGKCAQPCRLPYELYASNPKYSKSDVLLDKGYLLSPRDLCGLEFIPKLIDAGVHCLKIEGRMKSPEYVATVTRIYRKYIDLAYGDKPYVVDENDVTELMQVFNRGMFSTGNFDNEPNTDYVYKEKPNNIGLYVGNVTNFDKKNSYINFKTNCNLKVGDKISTEKQDGKYTISKLLIDDKEVSTASPEDYVTMGRIKGYIEPGDKIYKLTSVSHNQLVREYFQRENKKIPLAGNIIIKKGLPISLIVTSLDNEDGIYFSMSSMKNIDIIPVEATNSPVTEERIIEQLCKTGDYPFEFTKVIVILDDNTYIPKISAINSLRRSCLDELMDIAITRFERENFDTNLDNILASSLENSPTLNDKNLTNYDTSNNLTSFDKSSISKHATNLNSYLNSYETMSVAKSSSNIKEISLLLNELDLKYDYSKLEEVNNIYIPLQYFSQDEYSDIIKLLSKHSKLYIVLPLILRDNFRNIISNNFDETLKKFNIYGLVISNISFVRSLEKYMKDLDIVANYNFNVFNLHTIKELKELNINRITISPELNKKAIQDIANSSPIPIELMCYGRLPLMNTGYCLIGSSNRCYPTCSMQCKTNSKFYLKDRIGLNFRLVPNNLQTITTIYNSKITSIPYSDLNVGSVRISILDENIDEINSIINNVKNDIVFEGNKFTKGSFNKTI